MPPWARITADGLELRVTVVPGARRAGIAGPLGDRLKLRVAAPPEDGRANRAVEALLAEWLGVARTAVVAGHAQRQKTVLAPGLAALPARCAAG